MNFTGTKEGSSGQLVNVVVTLQGSSTLPTPTTWRFVSGKPAWMKLNKLNDTTVQLSGTPTQGGSHTIEIEAIGASCKVKGSTTIKIYGPLEELIKPALKGAATLKVAELGKTIRGGKAPYRCSFYRGSGRGTVPAGVTQDPADTTGCTLKGMPNNTNAPGSYGFLMNVEDSLGQAIQVPIFYKHGTCSAASNRLTITPPIANGVTHPAGSAYTYKVELSDLNYTEIACSSNAFCQQNAASTSVCIAGKCATPAGVKYCGYERISITLYLGPLTAGTGLVCSATEPVCMDCSSTESACFTGPTNRCPNKQVMTQYIRMRAHTAIRAKKAPAFQTLEPRYLFPNNAARNTSCHFEVLERD